MWKRRRPDGRTSDADALTLECELVLAGRYAPYRRAQGLSVAPWAWAGVLAHASEEDLRAWASVTDTDSADRSFTTDWRAAVAFLAEDILNHTRGRGTTLAELQRSTLVPLELDLMKSSDGATLRPGELAGRVLAAVHRHPGTPQH